MNPRQSPLRTSLSVSFSAELEYLNQFRHQSVPYLFSFVRQLLESIDHNFLGNRTENF